MAYSKKRQNAPGMAYSKRWQNGEKSQPAVTASSPLTAGFAGKAAGFSSLIWEAAA